MRIAIVCHPTHGGSGVIASELALGLAERGHTTHIVSYAVPFRLHDYNPRVRIHEVEVDTYPLFKYPPYTLGLATKLAEVASEESLDIIHAHYAVPHAVSAFLAKEILGDIAPKIVTTLHGTDITLVGADASFKRITRFAMEVSDSVTAVSKFLRNRTIEEFQLSRSVEVIYNFVDTAVESTDSVYRREHWAPDGEKILVHASNFRPVKRVSDVVRIFELIQKKVPAKLLLVGKGPERLFVQQLIKELRLSEHVFFLGEHDSLEAILKCSDLLVLPSEQESFGLVALEAMACGIPVIGTKVGGLPEVVTHAESGYLKPVGDIQGLADAALKLLTNKETYQSFSSAARSRAKEFAADKIIPQYEALYENLL